MFYRKLGDTNLNSSFLGFGGASLSGEGGGYGMGLVSEKEAETLIKLAVDSGINIFDTAPIYGFGLSEERLGKYLPKNQFIISKGGVDWHENKRVNMSNDPKIISKMLHASLKRLKRDCIDLYMIHWPDPRVDITEPIKVLLKAKEDGKIRFIGLCNTNQDDLKKASALTTISVVQSEYNIFNTKAFQEISPLLASSTGFMGWGTFDKGILTGRVHEKRKYDSVDARSWAPWWKKQDLSQKLKIVKDLSEFCTSESLELIDAALAFGLLNPKNSCSLVGLKSPEDIQVAIKSLERLTPTKLEKLKAYFSN